MNEQLRICFIGKMRSGKSEAIEYLKTKYDIEVVDFGDSLKEVVDKIYPKQAEYGIKNRALLQRVGQHMRKMDEDIWLHSVDHKIKKSNKKIVACASCRQQNEYDYLNKMAFLFVKVECKDSTRIKRAEDSGDYFKLENFTHETELKIDDFMFDYRINNDGNIEDLHRQIDLIMKDIMKGE